MTLEFTGLMFLSRVMGNIFCQWFMLNMYLGGQLHVPTLPLSAAGSC